MSRVGLAKVVNQALKPRHEYFERRDFCVGHVDTKTLEDGTFALFMSTRRPGKERLSRCCKLLAWILISVLVQGCCNLARSEIVRKYKLVRCRRRKRSLEPRTSNNG